MAETKKSNKSKFLFLIAFISGMVIMSVEMSASRLLAPHFGTSIFVWTNIIGLVMIALSLGYYFGGKLADKNSSRIQLMKIILLASVFIIIIPLMIRPVVDLTTMDIFKANISSIIILVGSFFSTLLLFVFPIFLLGMVSPYIIKLLSIDDKNIGNISGSVFAFSTLGSILGTFISTLILIPTIGTKRTIMASALVLMLFSTIGLMKKNKKYLILILLFLPLMFLNIYVIKNDAKAVYEVESPYQYIQVVNESDGTNYLFYNEGMGINSVYNPDKNITGYYYDYYNVLPEMVDKKELDVLIIGFAGGTIANQFKYFSDDKVINIDGVEIDDKVVEISKKYFDTDNKGFNIYNQEGRMFLNQTDSQYDLIIIDAYNNQLQIPFHLATREFFGLVKNKLKENGKVAINVNAESQNSDLLIAISNSIACNFTNTNIVPVNHSYNYMIVGSDNDINYDKISNKDIKPELGSVLKFIKNYNYDYNYDNDGIELTDDRAPIEYLTDKMILEYLRE